MSVEQPFAPASPAERAPAAPTAGAASAGHHPAAGEPVVGTEAGDGDVVAAQGVPGVADGIAGAADSERAAVAGEVATGPDSGDAAAEGQVDLADLPVAERVRRRVAALDGIADLPLSEHAQRYDEVHAELQAALTEIDGESG